jgi:predicted Fe-Mo cluster-binding NifX family protein
MTTQRIVVSVLADTGLSAPISPHFGRCPYFTVIDMEDGEVTAVENVTNPYFSNHQPGEVPGFIKSLDADVMMSGGMGGRAVAFFNQYGIDVATGATGTVQEALDCFLAGELQGAAPCTESDAHGHGGHRHSA